MSSASSRYEIELSEVAKKELAGLEDKVQLRVRLAFSLLSSNPRPPRAIKLQGNRGYRVRVGDYRIVYEVFDKKVLVLVLRIGHRREVYRKP